MCDSCGCADVHEHDGHVHSHAHGEHEHTHDYSHEHREIAQAARRVVQVEQRVLAKNDEMANLNRSWFQARGVCALNLISSPGSGKTLLLEKTLEMAHGSLSCAVIAGDQQTDNDAQRLQGKGAPVCQIETVNACHLDAERVAHVLPQVLLDGITLVFIENVGNLVCPSAFDLGEHHKIALLSVTEGEDKPEKYPTLFAGASVVVITKTDLIPHLDWDRDRCRTSIESVHPGVRVIETSARTGEGMQEWIAYLQEVGGSAARA